MPSPVADLLTRWRDIRARSGAASGISRATLIGALLIVGAVLTSHLGGAYAVTIVGQAGAFAVAVVGYNLVVGEAGLFSLGTAAFMGVGVYGYVIFANHGLSSLEAAGSGLGVTLVVALVIGVITIRLKDVYFGIGTFCAAGILQNVVSQLTGLTGGDNGTIVPRFSALGIDLGGSVNVFPWVAGSLVLAVALHECIARSAFGRTLRCIRDDEAAASAMGVRVMRQRLIVFCIGACFAVWGGLLYALSLEYVDPTLLGVDQTVLILVMLVVGGTGTVVGALVGCFVIWLTPDLLQPLAIWWEFAYGLVVVGSVLVGRRGLVGAVSQLARLAVRLTRRGSSTEHAQLHGVEGTWAPYVLPQRRTEMHAPEATALIAHGVTKRFGGVGALDGVDVEFEAGAVHAIIGPNGSGKSTLVNVLTGLLRPDAGEMMFGDYRLTKEPPYRLSRVGLVRTFQTPRLFEQASVLDNVRPMAEVAGYRGRAGQGHAMHCLAAVGLDGFATDMARELPQGYKRLLEIARALALVPRVFFLDEPAAGLAGEEWRQLQTLLEGLAASGVAVVVIEHNMEFVLGVAHRITVLRSGQVLAVGSPQEIQTNPLVQEAYLGSSYAGAGA